MMAKKESTVGLSADPNDPDDFDVSDYAIEQALTSRRLRGAQVGQRKVPISIRLDADVVEHFRATGAGWQARVNAVLRKEIA